MATTSGDPAAFAKEMADSYREKMRAAADEYYNADLFDTFDSPEALIRDRFPDHAWREYFLGCLPTGRQIHLIYEQGEPYGRDRDLMLALGKQFRDELKHTNVFANLVGRFDDDIDLVDWNPPYYDHMVAHARPAIEWDKPQYCAAGFQLSTEILAAFLIENLGEYLRPYYPNVGDALVDLSSDEGDHIHAGRLVAARFAEPGDFEQMEAIAQEKYDAAMAVLKEY